MGRYTLPIPVEQNGCFSGGVWTESPPGESFSVGVAGDTLIGLVYNVQQAAFGHFDSDSAGRTMDGPIWVSSGDITLTNTSVFGGLVDAFFLPNPQPDLFSTTNPPTLTGAVTIAEDIVIASVLDATGPVSFSSAVCTALRGFVTSRAVWNGRVALVLDWDVGIATSMRVSSIESVVFQTFWNGLVGGPSGPRRRWVRDHRFALPALNSEVIRDGDQPSLWVRPFDSDPFDEPQTYRPRPGEGTVDDEISDL